MKLPLSEAFPCIKRFGILNIVPGDEQTLMTTTLFNFILDLLSVVHHYNIVLRLVTDQLNAAATMALSHIVTTWLFDIVSSHFSHTANQLQQMQQVQQQRMQIVGLPNIDEIIGCNLLLHND